MAPAQADSTIVHARLTCGSASENGATPRMLAQMTILRPKRSPIGPPATVPAAIAARNTNRYVCDCGIGDAELLDEVEGVVVREAHEVEVLRDHQRHEDGDGRTRRGATAARGRRRRGPGGRRRGGRGACRCTRRRRARARPCRPAARARTRRSTAGRAARRSTRRAAGRATLPKLPPTWNSACASPCRRPAAMWAIRDASG